MNKMNESEALENVRTFYTANQEQLLNSTTLEELLEIADKTYDEEVIYYMIRVLPKLGDSISLHGFLTLIMSTLVFSGEYNDTTV